METSKPLRREFMLYVVSIFIDGCPVAKSKNPIEASSPCKAAELFMMDDGLKLREGHAATVRVQCTSCPVAFDFDIVGIKA